VAEHAGIRVALVKGSSANKKITTKEDIHMAGRVGSGYDVHRLVPGRPLILLGTPIPAKLGLDGHSDADVAAHALMDALLGAAALGDIGRHFPDTDDKYKGADSMKLLAEVRDMLGGAKIVNVDITIIAQAPKLAPYIDQMKNNVAQTLGIPGSAVNVKATTEEGLGFTGRGEGIAAQAVCIIEGSF
jgi:2-C-methyl-D-erythritol 4-phosphate cytidylyltransferase/2-C-methyl-D-erythritol 2,4-cyclodiphosphate synthase